MTQKLPSSSIGSIDTTLEVLSNASRREILLSLSAPDDAPVARDDLAGPDDRDHAIELVHVHLPKLEDEGFIEWDREAGELRRGPRFEEARPLLKVIHDHGRPDRG